MNDAADALNIAAVLRSFLTKIHTSVDALGNPLRLILTGG
jgi:hypothetical protein